MNDDPNTLKSASAASGIHPTAVAVGRAETDAVRPVDPGQVSLKSILRDPLLLRGEDPDVYAIFLDSMVSAIGPQDMIEDIWVRDITSADWELRRLTQLRVGYLEALRRDGLVDMFETFLPDIEELGTSRERAERSVDRNLHKAGGDANIREWLADNDLFDDFVVARGFAGNLRSFAQFDEMIEGARKRRDRLIKDLEQRRIAKRGAVIRGAREVIDQ